VGITGYYESKHKVVSNDNIHSKFHVKVTSSEGNDIHNTVSLFHILHGNYATGGHAVA
jgi:hypothetical protein